MAALPACSDIAAPTSCAPCVFSAQNTYLEYPYHVVPITVDLIPYIWELGNGTNTTYISRVTQTSVVYGYIYDEDQTPVWTVNGVELTSGTTYAQFTNFVGAPAPTEGCANPAAESEIALPASLNPSSLIYPLPAANAHNIPAATETAVLNYLGSLQTVVAQLGGNEPSVCSETITSTPQPTACISSSLSTSITCYDYMYGEQKCVTRSRVVKRTIDLLEERQDASTPSEIPTPTTSKAPGTGVTSISVPTGGPQSPTSSSTSSSSSSLSSSPSSSSAAPSSSSQAATTPQATPTPSSSSSSVETPSPTPSSSSSALQTPTPTSESTVSVTSASSSSVQSPSPSTSLIATPSTVTITQTQGGTTTVFTTIITASSQSSSQSSSSAASSSAASSSTASLSTTTLTLTQGTTTIVVVTALPESTTQSSPTIVQPSTDQSSSAAVITKTQATGLGTIVPKPVSSPVYSSPPTITTSSSSSPSNPPTGTALSEILPSSSSPTPKTTGTEAGETLPTVKPSQSDLGPMPLIDTSTSTAPTMAAPGGGTATSAPANPHVHSTTITYYAGPNGTSVSVSMYTGAANKMAAIPVGGVLGFIAGLAAAL